MLSGFDSGGVDQVRDLPRELLDLGIELALAGRPLVRRSPILRQARRSRWAGLGCQRMAACGGGRAEGGVACSCASRDANATLMSDLRIPLREIARDPSLCPATTD